MSAKNPFKDRPFAPKGASEFEALYPAVGRALNNWEHAENSFAHLFGTIIRPGHNSYAARRAYGSIATARGRVEMLKAVGEVFFRNFTGDKAENAKDTMKTLLTHCTDASARRNELAHGIVGGDKDDDGQFGYFVVPSAYNTNKRGLDSGIKYRYSTIEIDTLRNNFSALSSRAINLADEIDEIFRSSPKKLQQRW